MTRRDEFLNRHPDFHPGMVAFSDDGQELGEVQKLDEENLTIEKGRFFSTDRRLPYEAVSDIRGDHLIINRKQADLEEWRTPDYIGLQESGQVDIEEAETGASVPIYQRDLEELERTEQDVGERATPREGPPDVERMETERTPAGETAGPMPGGESFRDEDIRIPVMEEEVEIRKRPVVKEEVRARKETRTEERDVSGEVRKEDVKIDRDRPEKKK